MSCSALLQTGYIIDQRPEDLRKLSHLRWRNISTPMSPYEEAMEAYRILMHEVKDRLFAIDTALAGRTGLPNGTICEFCFLRLRMVCELIALGCLTAHGELLTGKLRGTWQADKIIHGLEELHPKFYPYAATDNETELKEGVFTKEELVKLWSRCGEVRAPMRQPDTIDIGSVIETQASSWYSHLVVILCCVAMVIEGYDAQVLAYAAPAIIRDWNIEQSYFGPVFGAALFGYMLGATLHWCERQDRQEEGHRSGQCFLRAADGCLSIRAEPRRSTCTAFSCRIGARLLNPICDCACRGICPRASSSIPSEHPIYRLPAGCGTWRNTLRGADREVWMAKRLLARRKRLAGSQQPSLTQVPAFPLRRRIRSKKPSPAVDEHGSALVAIG
jgi:hypothetical protein